MTVGDGLSRSERVEVIQAFMDWQADFLFTNGRTPNLGEYVDHLELDELRRKAADV